MVIFKYNDFLPKLVLRLETTYNTRDQDNREILNYVREKFLSLVREKFLSCVKEKFELCERKTFKLCERNLLSCVRKKF